MGKRRKNLVDAEVTPDEHEVLSLLGQMDVDPTTPDVKLTPEQIAKLDAMIPKDFAAKIAEQVQQEKYQG